MEISASNFRTNIATEKSFTPLCFSRKGAPNYVYVDLKMSPLNLTLDQCKFDLRSMSKTSKLCQVVYPKTPLGYSAERAPLEGGGGQILPPYLPQELVVVARWARRQTKALDDYFLSNCFKGDISGQGQIKGQNCYFSPYRLLRRD